MANKRYEELIMPFVKRSQSDGFMEVAMRWANPQTGWGIWVLHAVVWVFTTLRVDRLGIFVAEWFDGGESKLEMPGYEWPEEK